MSDCGRYLRLWDDSGDVWTLEPHDAGSIDAAVTHFLETGRDSLMHLTSLSGEDVVIRASRVECWLVTTPESRFRELEFQKSAAIETAENCEALGIMPADNEGD